MSDMFTQVTVVSFEPYGDNEQTLDDVIGSPEPWEQPELSEGDTRTLIAAWTSKYETDAREWAGRYTDAHPGASVYVREEWIGEGGPSVDEYVYGKDARDGAVGTTSRQVPRNLPELIAAVKRAQQDFEHFESTTGEHAMAVALSNATATIITTLENAGLA